MSLDRRTVRLGRRRIGTSSASNTSVVEMRSIPSAAIRPLSLRNVASQGSSVSGITSCLRTISERLQEGAVGRAKSGMFGGHKESPSRLCGQKSRGFTKITQGYRTLAKLTPRPFAQGGAKDKPSEQPAYTGAGVQDVSAGPSLSASRSTLCSRSPAEHELPSEVTTERYVDLTDQRHHNNTTRVVDLVLD
jgi:hypothetical protein